MAKTLVVLRGGDLGDEKCMVRCDLSEASSPVEVDWCNDSGRPSGWESTQYQCADTSHRWSGLAGLAMQIAADGVRLHEDYFDCDVLDPDDLSFDDRVTLGLVDSDIIEIADVLDPYGDRMAGGDVEATAHEWRDHSFTPDEVDEWCEIGCWNPATAAVWRESGLTPEIVATAAEVLLLSLPEGSDPRDSYTDGCPIYSCCNDDTDPEVMIACCRDVMREFDSHTLTLQEWANDRQYVVVYVMGTAYPTGTTAPYGNPDMDWLERIGVDKLCGTVDDYRGWQWNGEGSPRDERGNSILNVIAYVDKKRWESAVAEYNAEV